MPETCTLSGTYYRELNGKISEILICVEFKLVMYSWCMFLWEVWVLTAVGLDIQTSETLCYVDW